MKEKKYPKTAFMMWNADDEMPPWLEVNERAQDFAELGQAHIVAEYKLVGLHEVKAEPKVTALVQPR